MFVFKVLIIIAILLEFFLVPQYVRAMWPEKTRKSLCIKVITASLYLAVALMSMAVAENTEIYARLMFGGLFMSWIGDFFLHVSPKTWCFLVGITSFFCGHVFYISAYCTAAKIHFPELPAFFPAEIIAVIIIFVLTLIAELKLSLKLNKHTAAPSILYGVILSTMAVKAVSLGIMLCMSGNVKGGVMLIFGGVNFFLSDASLAIIYFTPHKSYNLKKFNMATYYAAQILLASSILFIS